VPIQIKLLSGFERWRKSLEKSLVLKEGRWYSLLSCYQVKKNLVDGNVRDDGSKRRSCRLRGFQNEISGKLFSR